MKCETLRNTALVSITALTLPTAVRPGVVHKGEEGFALRCTSHRRCAAVYAGGLQVVVWRAEGSAQLGAVVEVPQPFYNRTVGLLGLWSSNRTDDFVMSDSRLVPWAGLNVPSEELLYRFGMSCEYTTMYCVL